MAYIMGNKPKSANMQVFYSDGMAILADYLANGNKTVSVGKRANITGSDC